jgi:hypothetical protein
MLKELEARPKALESVPSWTQSVPRISETLVIPDESNQIPTKERRSEQFLEKNIICVQPHILFF